MKNSKNIVDIISVMISYKGIIDYISTDNSVTQNYSQIRRSFNDLRVGSEALIEELISEKNCSVFPSYSICLYSEIKDSGKDEFILINFKDNTVALVEGDNDGYEYFTEIIYKRELSIQESERNIIINKFQKKEKEKNKKEKLIKDLAAQLHKKYCNCELNKLLAKTSYVPTDNDCRWYFEEDVTNYDIWKLNSHAEWYNKAKIIIDTYKVSSISDLEFKLGEI